MSGPIQRGGADDRPTIRGGRPVRQRMLPYGRQDVSEADIQAVVVALRGDWPTNGPTVVRFEEAFAAQVGAGFAAALSSGTAALHAAAAVAGLGPGDEVILSPLTTFSFHPVKHITTGEGGMVTTGDPELSARGIGRRSTTRCRCTSRKPSPDWGIERATSV